MTERRQDYLIILLSATAASVHPLVRPPHHYTSHAVLCWFSVNWKAGRCELAGGKDRVYGFLFSVADLSADVKWGDERLGEVFRGFADRQAVIGGPEIERVALGLALRVEAAENALVQVDREGAMLVAWRIVQGARSAALRSGALQGIEVAEVTEGSPGTTTDLAEVCCVKALG